MNYVVATQSRSGSQFLMHLLLSCIKPAERSVISGSRQETYRPRDPSFREFMASGRPEEYFSAHDIDMLKIEEPGEDMVAWRVSHRFPNAKWLTSKRRIEDVMISHHNLRWGRSEQKLLTNYKKAYELFEDLTVARRLFILDIDRPDKFDLNRFCDFIGADPTRKTYELIESWPVINPLSRQQDISGQNHVKQIPPGLHTVRRRNPWLPVVEGCYDQLWQKCSAPISTALQAVAGG